MINEVKKVWQRGGHICLFLLLMLPATISVSATRIHSGDEYPPPIPSITSQGSGSISFAWDAVEGAISYRVSYYRKESSYSSSVTNTGSTNITYSGLSAGTYNFYFKSVFSGAQSSDYIIEDVVIL